MRLGRSNLLMLIYLAAVAILAYYSYFSLSLYDVASAQGYAVPEEANYWLNGFPYRRPILINNTLNSNNLTDYQIELTIDTASLISYTVFELPITINNTQNSDTLTDYQVKVNITNSIVLRHIGRNDCGDIRFFNHSVNDPYSNTDGKLNYWVESCDKSSSLVVWVKVPSIPASGTKTIYMYYGNPNAMSESNATVVFDFFDDMEVWSGWTQYGSGQVSQDNTRFYDGNYSAHKTSNNDPNGAYKAVGKTLGRDVILEFWVNRNSGYSGGAADRVGFIDDSGNGYGWYYAHSSDLLGLDRRDSYSATLLTTASVTDYMDKWVFGQLIVMSNGTITAKIYVDGVLNGKVSKTDTTYSTFTRVYIFGGYDYWVDQIRVRKFANPEPTVSVGSEDVKESVLGKMRSDCGDIRFTDSDGVTELSYWIESGCGTNSTKIWVKVPSIPASGTKTIYMYYGNPSATSESNAGELDIWQLREFDCWNAYKPDIRFTKPVSSVLRLDSYTGGSSSMGHGYAFIELPREWLNGKKVSIRWRVYFSSTATRTIATLHVFNESFYRTDTTQYMKPDSNTEDIFDVTNIELAKYDCDAGGWCDWVTTTNGTLDLSGWKNRVTLLIRLIDGWVGQTTMLEVDWIKILNPDGTVYKMFDFNDSVVMEVNDTLNDYGLFRKFANPEPTLVVGKERALITIVGRPSEWKWKIPTPGACSFYFSNEMYRFPIYIHSNAEDVLRDYQLKLNISYKSGMNQNFTDLRFTYLNQSNHEEIEIPYWIEEKKNASWALIWTKIPLLTPSKNEKIYVYYGNTTPLEDDILANNATNVFIFFDDFENITGWNVAGGGSYSQVCGAFTTDRTCVIEVKVSSSNGGVYKIVGLNIDFPVELDGEWAKFGQYGVGWDNSIHVGLINESGYGYGFKHTDGSSTPAIVEFISNYTKYESIANSVSSYCTNVLRFKIIIDNGTVTVWDSCLGDDISTVNATAVNSTVKEFSKIYIYGKNYNAGFYVDNLFLRKYTPKEPTVTQGEIESRGNVTYIRSGLPHSWSWTAFCNNEIPICPIIGNPEDWYYICIG